MCPGATPGNMIGMTASSPTGNPDAYALDVRITDTTDNYGYPCVHCAHEDHTNQATVYYWIGDGEEQVREATDCCLACIVPMLDSTGWLDTDSPIVVEVARQATNRPF